MFKFISLLLFSIANVISIYTIDINNADGEVIHLSNYAAKKILIVNIATGNANNQQIADLETLYQQHKDSLVIIAIPSNDFGNEPLSNAAIVTTLGDTYHAHFIIGEKSNVTGPSASNLYQWLSNETLNGMMNGVVRKDFYKFLVNEDGKLVGVFSDEVNPLNEKLQLAIDNQ